MLDIKPLCFTTSFKRPYYLYNTINNILNQTYQDITYSININIENESEKDLYLNLLQDFLSDTRLKISFNPKRSQQINYITAITKFLQDHNLFIKIDDDDIYHKNYIKTAIEVYKKQSVDILSFYSHIYINNNNIIGTLIDSIGSWDGDDHNIKFGMPSSYIFNLKALNALLHIHDIDIRSIHIWEDAAWRKAWRDNNLTSFISEESNMLTYNIHGSNVSSGFLLDRTSVNTQFSLIENEYCDIIYFNHSSWSSYIILNKRNNRLYNINNNDHGFFIKEDDIIKIKWDNYGEENFKKIYKNNIYYYNLVQ